MKKFRFVDYLLILAIVILLGCGGGSSNGENNPENNDNLLKVITAVASSTATDSSVSYAYDNNLETSWSAKTPTNTSPQYIYLDFGSSKSIRQVVLCWGMPATEYKVQVSNDASSWNDIYVQSSGTGHVENIVLPTASSGRYLRLYTTKCHNDQNLGVSLWEFSAYSTSGNTTPASPAGNNLIWNGDFSSGKWCWGFGADDGIDMSATFKDGVMNISTAKNGANEWSIHCGQGQIPLEKNSIYTLTFEAWADSSRTGRVLFEEDGRDLDGDGSTWTTYYSKHFNLTTECKTYTGTFLMSNPDDTFADLTFQMGQDAGAFHIKNVSLKKVALSDPVGTVSVNETSTTIAQPLEYTIPSCPAFKMIDATGDKQWNYPKNDGTVDSATVDPFYISETLVTAELWKKVTFWAVNHGYSFGHSGSIGAQYDFTGMRLVDNEPGGVQQPVTGINCRDAMVWCNALTEYYNAYRGGCKKLDCVYYTDGNYTTPIRKSTIGNINFSDGTIDKPYIKCNTSYNTDMGNNTASGFRLLTGKEYLYAARYNGSDSTNAIEYPSDSGKYWTRCDSVSGAPSNSISDAMLYAVLKTTSTLPVKSRRSNKLNIFDITGNVRQYTFDYSMSTDLYRLAWGFDILSTDKFRLDEFGWIRPVDTTMFTGFHFAKNR